MSFSFGMTARKNQLDGGKNLDHKEQDLPISVDPGVNRRIGGHTPLNRDQTNTQDLDSHKLTNLFSRLKTDSEM